VNDKMIKREKYLKEIRPFYDDDLIKIITGVRRCGKSIILEQIMDEIREKSTNIVYLDFENRALTRNISTWIDIVDYVNSNRVKDSLCYVFLDEVQLIDEWYSACKSLRLDKCSIFITGSNSKLLSSEFTKELSGRFISFRIRPFVYREIQEYSKELNSQTSITDYLVWGGFPKSIEYLSSSDKIKYLNDLDSTIVLIDLINRYKIRKEEQFKKVVNFILISNSKFFSALSISNYMKAQGTECSVNTINKWITYLENAYVIDEIKKYSRKAKRELDQVQKLYDCDVSLNSIRCINNLYDITHNFENIVYNELIYMGYDLYVYDNNGKEIDFYALKNGKKYFIQVAYSIIGEDTYNREFNAFNNISQVDKKIIITNDEIDFSTSNVQHIKFNDLVFLNDLD